MALAKWLGIFEKLLLVLLTFGIVVWLWVVFSDWADPFRSYFSLVGNLEMLIYVSVFILVLNYIFKKLLLWQVHMLFKPGQRGRTGKKL